MSQVEKCPRCDATYPVVQGGCCGGCMPPSALSPSSEGKDAGVILAAIVADWEDGRFSDDLMELHIRDAKAALSRPADSPSDSLVEATVIVRNMLELWQDAVVNLERGAARNLASAKVSVLEDVLAALAARDRG